MRAILLLGIYPTNGKDACKYILEDSRCAILVVEDQKQLEKVKIDQNGWKNTQNRHSKNLNGKNNDETQEPKKNKNRTDKVIYLMSKYLS